MGDLVDGGAGVGGGEGVGDLVDGGAGAGGGEGVGDLVDGGAVDGRRVCRIRGVVSAVVELVKSWILPLLSSFVGGGDDSRESMGGRPLLSHSISSPSPSRESELKVLSVSSLSPSSRGSGLVSGGSSPSLSRSRSSKSPPSRYSSPSHISTAGLLSIGRLMS